MNSCTTEQEKITDCHPYLEYRDGSLYEVIQVGDRGSTIARVIHEELVKKIKADGITELMRALCDYCTSTSYGGECEWCPFHKDGCEVVRIAEKLKGEREMTIDENATINDLSIAELELIKNKCYEVGRTMAFQELLKELCIGCNYLNGIKCENPLGCPCVISKSEVLRTTANVLEMLNKQNS